QLLQVAKQLGLPGAGGQASADDSASQSSPQNGPSGQPTAAEAYQDPELMEAQQAMERGDLDGAAAAFERILANAPGDPVATLGLAQVNLFRRVHSYNAEQARRAAAAKPDDVEAQCQVADIEMSLGKAEEAFDRLLGLIRRTSGEDRNKARLHLVQLFEIFPPRDPRVAKARATLSSLLF
ncbi:MAG TPA: tetratricopeptide repeat protein, partial [Streptosporangiaceae bacterium]